MTSLTISRTLQWSKSSTRELTCKCIDLRVKEAAQTIHDRLLVKDAKVQMLSLFLLEFCMKKCSYPFHNQIGLKSFMNTLVVLISSKDVHQSVSLHLLPGKEENPATHPSLGYEVPRQSGRIALIYQSLRTTEGQRSAIP